MDHASFKDFVVDQLSSLPELRAKAMFGGHGLYQGEIFFAILAEGRLYLKTDATTSEDFLKRGMGPFTYEQRGRKMTMRYHEVPPDVLDDRTELAHWATRAVAVAAGKTKRPQNRRPRKTAEPRGTQRQAGGAPSRRPARLSG